jgi:hypothetical protein
VQESSQEIGEGGTILTTQRKVLANQLNAAKSTGPRTPDGKAVSSKNAIKLGLRTPALLPSEDEAAYQALTDDYYRDLQPVGTVETSLVEEMIRCDWWRRERAVQAETQIFASIMKRRQLEHADPLNSREWLRKALAGEFSAGPADSRGQQTTTEEDEERSAQRQEEEGKAQIWFAFNDYETRGVLERIQRYATTYDNKYYRALHELLRLQAARHGQKVAPPVAMDLSISNASPPKR